MDDVVAKLKRIKFDSLENSRSQVVTKPGELEDEEEAKKDWRQETACVCQRPLQLVLCGLCGETFPARLRRSCVVHPR